MASPFNCNCNWNDYSATHFPFGGRSFNCQPPTTFYLQYMQWWRAVNILKANKSTNLMIPADPSFRYNAIFRGFYASPTLTSAEWRRWRPTVRVVVVEFVARNEYDGVVDRNGWEISGRQTGEPQRPGKRLIWRHIGHPKWWWWPWWWSGGWWWCLSFFDALLRRPRRPVCWLCNVGRCGRRKNPQSSNNFAASATRESYVEECFVGAWPLRRKMIKKERASALSNFPDTMSREWMTRMCFCPSADGNSRVVDDKRYFSELVQPKPKPLC